MRPKHLVTILVLLTLALPAASEHAGGIVSICDEAHLRAALAGGGTVTFSCSGTITLTATITIATDTTIDGSGQTVTISGNHAVRVFTANSGVALNLNELTVADGVGVFTIACGIVNNGGTVTVNNSTFSGCSGIQNEGTLVVTNSTFSGNSGPGILNGSSGSLTVDNCTFSGKSHGAIINSSGSVTVSNSTFSGNGNSDYAGGGIRNGWGTVTVSNSTFAGNQAGVGGGIYTGGGTMTLKNTIVANSPTGGNCSGDIVDGGGNLSYPDATCPGINKDPVLGPLHDNGGPTQTMALGAGSAARDAGDGAICAAAPVNSLDQRGVVRPQGAGCDIGAFEARTTLVTNANDSGPGSLRQALADADTGGIISFAGDGNIHLSSPLSITRDVGIDGAGWNVTVSESSYMLVLVVNPGVWLSLNKLTIADTQASGYSAGIYNDHGTLTVSNSTFSGNSAGYGGGIYNDIGTLTVSNSTFSGNEANWGGSGGGILNNGMATVINSTFAGNSAGFGGGIYNRGTLTVSNSTFAGNQATNFNDGGGGIGNNGTLTVSNSTFAGNQAKVGGGIYSPGGTATLKNTIVANSPTGGNCGGTISDGGGNLSYPDATCPGINSDPMLGPLQKNGGPTQTMALRPGSAAVDAANDAICVAPPVNNLDQRGMTRPEGPHCDIGAYEARFWHTLLPIMMR